MRLPIGVALAAGVLAAACATRPVVEPAAPRDDLGLQSARLYVGRQARLLGVSYAIRTAGAELCGDRVGPILGFAAWRGGPRFSASFSQALFELFGVVDEAVAVVAVVPGSPADRAGIAVGDRIVTVDGRAVHTETAVFSRARAVRNGPVRVGLRRDGQLLEARVEPLIACRHEAFIEFGDLMLTDRASADHFYVTSGYIRFAESDDELALVVAHELAHRLTGMGVVAGPTSEVRADQVGLYLAARAGYDVQVAPEFWDRVALEQPWTLSEDVEHHGWNRVPPHGYMAWRAAVIRHFTDEIREKLRRDEPLVPETD